MSNFIDSEELEELREISSKIPPSVIKKHEEEAERARQKKEFKELFEKFKSDILNPIVNEINEAIKENDYTLHIYEHDKTDIITVYVVHKLVWQSSPASLFINTYPFQKQITIVEERSSENAMEYDIKDLINNPKSAQYFAVNFTEFTKKVLKSFK